MSVVHRIHLIDVNRNPTDAQKEAGNYRKGHVRWNGLDITIENPRGSVRSKVSAHSGKRWSNVMQHHYGYIRRTEGNDGDHVDCYLGPHLDSGMVYVVNQRRPHDHSFDEHKVMLGFRTPEAAKAGYLANYSDGWDGFHSMKAMTIQEFRQWLRSDGTKAMVKRLFFYKTVPRSTSP